MGSSAALTSELLNEEVARMDYATLLRDHVTLTCRSVDRLFLQAFVPQLQTPGWVARFCSINGTSVSRLAWLWGRLAINTSQTSVAGRRPTASPFITSKRE